MGFDCSYSYADGFGASVGGGYKIAQGLGVGFTLSYNEQSGFGASVGLQAGTSRLNFNAGLSYSQRDGISGNAGLNYGLGKDPKVGLNLGVSYNRRDGMGASVGLTSRSGTLQNMGANITRSEYSGWGADISSREYGPGKFSGGLSYNQRDGFTASLNVAGTNALNYNSQTGLSSNADFIAQYSMNRGMSEDSNETAAEAESRAAQERNLRELGAQILEGMGFAATRREGEAHVTGFGDHDGSTPAHGAPSSHGPDQMIASSGSVDGKPAGGRQLSAHDRVAFGEEMRGQTKPQMEATLAELRSMGYNTTELESAVRNQRDLANRGFGGYDRNGYMTTLNPGDSINVVGTRDRSLVDRASSLLGSVVNGAKGLWNSVTGGRTPNGVYNSAGIEAGIDRVLNSKAAYDPGMEQRGANWTPGKLENGERYSNIHYTQSKDADGNTVYERVYRSYDLDKGKYTVAGTETVSAATYNAAMATGNYQRFTSCNMVNHEIATAFGAVSPFMPQEGGTQYHANDDKDTGKKGIYGNLRDGKYDTDTHQYRSVGFEDAEKNASRGGLSIAVTDGHIVTLTGGYKGTQGKASDLNIFQGGKSGVGPMTIQRAFGENEERKPGYYSNGKNLQYYVWEKK
ncbi:hypothetical protein FH581_000200 [Leptospira weilii]|nr:hypothetical protein [Leptospira weilii]UPY77312.1 hypothetical protein FH581_000200 [Leptospira weilii]